jgi:ribonuclease G
MSTELIVNASLPETRIALMESGEIQELLIERAQGKGIVGNIYKGRVTRVLPGMQAAFVDIGLEKAAFLYVDDVYVHSEIWAEEEGSAGAAGAGEASPENGESFAGEETPEPSMEASGEAPEAEASVPEDDNPEYSPEGEYSEEESEQIEIEAEEALAQHPELLSEEEAEDQMAAHLADEDEEEDDDGEPMSMGPEGGEDDENAQEPKGTVSRHPDEEEDEDDGEEGDEPSEGGLEAAGAEGGPEGGAAASDESQRDRAGRRRRRGRRGGKNRRRGREGERPAGEPRGVENASGAQPTNEEYPESYRQQVSEAGDVQSDRSELSADAASRGVDTAGVSNRPEGSTESPTRAANANEGGGRRPEFKEPRNRDRRIKSKQSMRPSRMNVSIQDLLKEGQEVIVQVAKDPIATKGARLTCHISLPGRHLVCMPTIDHVGVSRRIERDEERRRLREYVDRNRPKGLGFIVRTATSSGKTKAEARIKQDIDYLSALWSEIKSKANAVSAPALVYEDLNPILRAIRDWVNEDIDKIIVDSRYHYNDVVRFVRNFMPNIMQKVELYQGDIPIFDAYSISTELARALERKVWLKSGGYLVIDQAEALVAIDVNTGRYVGKKSLEDTILKTNLEAVREIAYQLRLRNCGGIIILDLIDMEREENKLRVYRALEEELKKDRSRPQILKISELGLVEMTRKRTRDTIVRALCDSCTQCEGKGYIKSKHTVAYEILREIEREGIERDVPKILIQAHPDVIDVLAIDERETLDQLERRYKKQIYLQAVADYHPEQYEVVSDKRRTSERSEDALLERARELAQTQDRGRRGRNRDRGRGRERGRDQNREGSGERSTGGREGGRDRNRGRDRDRDRDQNRDQQRDPNKPRISIRPGIPPVPADAAMAAQAPVDPDAQPQTYSHGSDDAAPRVRIANGDLGESSGNSATTGGEDGMNEEDRLAYLRAQAAQDAALAGQPGNAARNGQGRGSQNGQSPSQGGGSRWGGKDKGRRGGRGGRGGRRGRFQRGTRGPAEGGAQVGANENASSGDGDGGSSGGDGGGQHGGGDHSNPPA